jgi:hypothetical protein
MITISSTALSQASGGLSFFDNTPLIVQNRGNGMIEVNQNSLIDLTTPATISVREIAIIENGVPEYTTKRIPNPQYRGRLAATNYEIFQFGVFSGLAASFVALCLFNK